MNAREYYPSVIDKGLRSGRVRTEVVLAVATIAVTAVLLSVAGILWALLGQGGGRVSTLKQGARIIQGQFFRARQCAASARIDHFLRICTTPQRSSTIQLFADTNHNGRLDVPGEGIQGKDADGADQRTFESVSLPAGAYCDESDSAAWPAGGGQGAAAQPAATVKSEMVLVFHFRPDGTCSRILAAARPPNAGGDCDFRVVSVDGKSDLRIFVDPAMGKISKMVYQGR